MGWKEIAIFLFSPGMVHYLVLFVHLSALIWWWQASSHV
jgi:hypothetical protein